MSDVTEYRVEYFNVAMGRWDVLPTGGVNAQDYAEAKEILSDAQERAKGVRFRITMRTCTPWCKCKGGTK